MRPWPAGDASDHELETKYALGPLHPATTGDDIVLWVALRAHHEPRFKGEESDHLPYHYEEFSIVPRSFTVLGLRPALTADFEASRLPANTSRNLCRFRGVRVDACRRVNDRRLVEVIRTRPWVSILRWPARHIPAGGRLRHRCDTVWID